MRTSELAGQAGVNAETLRYYERRGLLDEPPRTAAGYRDYPGAALDLLRFIKRAQELGFTLDEIEELLHLDKGGSDSCDATRALAQARRADLEARIADLTRMRDSLTDLIATCELPRADRRCQLLAAINDQHLADQHLAATATRRHQSMSVTVEVLHVPDCPNLHPLLDRLRAVTDLPVTTREILTQADAAAHGMTGSPTLLINGADPFAEAGRSGCGCGVSCRIYRDEHGHPVGAPTVAQLRSALTAARGPVTCTTDPATPLSATDSTGATSERAGQPVKPAGVLSAWRTRALPLEPVQKAVQQAILRSFATGGHPPTAIELDQITAGSGRSTADVLAALHDLDAIRLTEGGEIVAAYPFSARPTRHRVHIGGHVDAGQVDGDRVDGGRVDGGQGEVYAMCAIDALGISAMLGADTHIDSIDATTGHPVRVSMIGGDSSWDPPTAVVFVGAHPDGGPSADCCCDYLNFFTHTAAATAWAGAHPQVPGQILEKAEAEDLAERLFASLLTE